jgi:hypothetical protein
MNEARNTFNSIAGKSQVTTSFWCYIGLHRWQKWSDVKETNKPGYSTLTQTIQDRYCDRCNTYDRKIIKG